MNAMKDMLSTTTVITLIMLAIVGAFYSTMDLPAGPNVVASYSDKP
ncbi:MAG: hypothetical protein JJ913_01770 [Rhizobiaceae bacterium]|nr:hypothetical protein [Rhizobiaceae bacterium]